MRDILGGGREALARYAYTPYGETALEAGLPLHVGFTGHLWEPQTGRYFAPFRYYSPGDGRWLTRDPLRFLDGSNVYSYVNNNPVSHWDALGLLTQRLCDQIRMWLDNERELGTWASVASASSIGTMLGGPGAGDFDNQNTPTAVGDMDIHYWLDIMLLGGWAPSYLILRTLGNLVERDPDWPLEDPEEQVAVEAVYDGIDTFAELFPPDFMESECGDDPVRYSR